MVASPPRRWTHRLPSPSFYPKKRTKPIRLTHAYDLPIGDEAAPNIFLLWGTRGVGKTLNMCAVGAGMKQHYAKHKQPTKIITNFKFEHADYSSPYLIDELLTYDPWYDESFALIDELTAYFHNRRSLARSAVDFSIFLTQIRKRHIELMFTTQFPTQVDIQVLQQIDYFVEPKALYLPGCPGRHTEHFIHDFWGHETGRYRRSDGSKKVWPPEPEEADWVKPVYNVNSLFGSYDTDELQASLWGGARQEIIERQWTKEQLMQTRGNMEPEIDPDHPPRGPLPEPRPAPTNLNEFLEGLKETGQFPVASIMEQVKLLDRSIDSTAKLRRHLESNGWSTMRRGPHWDAEWIQGG